VKPRLVGLGAGGHAAVVIEVIQLAGVYEIIGLLSPVQGRTPIDLFGIPILGTDELLSELHGKGVRHFFVGAGSVGCNQIRERLFDLGLEKRFEPITVMHPSAVLSPSAKVGRGSTILAGAIVGARAELGQNVIINTGAIVEHDCTVGDHAHVATRACLAGAVTVGEGTHVGIGACVRQGIRLGRRMVVGAGAVVVKNTKDGVVVAGVPAVILKSKHASNEKADY
jgi:UDP-perosamine 4-acetyltransferase